MGSPITTHVLDLARGRPAAGVPVTLDLRTPDGSWKRLGAGCTDADGRLRSLMPEGTLLERAVYRITFDTAHYFRAVGVEGFYPEASVVFEVRAANEHHHVPLLLSPFGYSTYRGS
jgi:5-hydroxyisourate hydrolase